MIPQRLTEGDSFHGGTGNRRERREENHKNMKAGEHKRSSKEERKCHLAGKVISKGI